MYLPKLCSCVNPANEKSMYVQYFFNCGTRLETIYSEKLLRLLTFVQEKEEGGGVVVKEAAMERLIPARPASCNSCESEIINVGIIRKKVGIIRKKWELVGIIKLQTM